MTSKRSLRVAFAKKTGDSVAKSTRCLRKKERGQRSEVYALPSQKSERTAFCKFTKVNYDFKSEVYAILSKKSKVTTFLKFTKVN